MWSQIIFFYYYCIVFSHLNYSVMSCSGLIQFMSSGPIIAFELIGDGAINSWRTLIGPTDSAVARSEAPTSLRARFGTGKYLI